MVGGNDGNQFRQYAGQNVRNQNGYNAVQNVRNQNVNQTRNGNVVAARAEGNGNGNANNVSSVEQSEGTTEQHPATVEETHAYFESLYNNLAIEAQTKTIKDSLQQKLHDTIYENAKLKAESFDKVSEEKDTTKGTSAITKFTNQSTAPAKVVESNDLSNLVTSNSVPITKASNVVKNDIVISPGMFRINPSKTSREYKFVPINQAR
nr:hypothetical protein [Tanacetum cinerariifolium]